MSLDSGETRSYNYLKRISRCLQAFPYPHILKTLDLINRDRKGFQVNPQLYLGLYFLLNAEIVPIFSVRPTD